MAHPTWDDCYRSGSLPWDTGSVEPLLREVVAAGRLPRGRALEIGCGTGTNARFLAREGFEVTAVDLSPTAIEQASGHAEAGSVRYAVHDILAAPAPGGPYDAVFDRGVFHVFDGPDAQLAYAGRVAEALRPGGVWLSLLGSTEGPPRDFGPPRRSARDIAAAVEPHLEILELRDAGFGVVEEGGQRAWLLLARKRTEPAQPSTAR